MSSNTSNMAKKVKEKSYVNPLIKMLGDKKSIINAIRDGRNLSTLKDVNIVSPI